MSNELSAWTAGFFDGEGCVYIRKTNAKGYKGGIRYDLSCAVTQRKTEELYALKERYGGSVALYKQKGANRAWGRWSVVANAAVMFLEDIKPFVKIKSKEVNLALEFQAAKGKSGKNLTDEQKTYQRETYLALQKLKE